MPAPLPVDPAYYKARVGVIQELDLPELTYLMVDGEGDPNHAPDFPPAISALYSLSYTLKFARKKAGKPDYKVGPLDGLWWMEGMREFDMSRRGDWRWTLMIVQPADLSQAEFAEILQQVSEKKPNLLLSRVRLERFTEGPVLQTLHLGSYAAEGPTVQSLHSYAAEHGLTLTGKHHEIYLSSPNPDAPAKQKTIIRQPVQRP